MDPYNRDSYRKTVSQASGDARWTMKTLFLPIICLMLFVFGLMVAGKVLGLFGSAVEVVTTNAEPKVIQERYEWFKNTSAALDSKIASIEALQSKQTNLTTQYDGKSRGEWAREDREQWNLWESETAGLKADFNRLAADYNAKMAMWNYAFTNVGDLPQGATTVMPREYKPYITN